MVIIITNKFYLFTSKSYTNTEPCIDKGLKYIWHVILVLVCLWVRVHRTNRVIKLYMHWILLIIGSALPKILLIPKQAKSVGECKKRVRESKQKRDTPKPKHSQAI